MEFIVTVQLTKDVVVVVFAPTPMKALIVVIIFHAQIIQEKLANL